MIFLKSKVLFRFIMVVLRSLLLLFVIFSMETAHGRRVIPIRACPRGWRDYGRQCYKYFPESVDWITAERNCQSSEANLASVHDQPENDFLLSLVPRSTRTWVGASDAQQDGEWIWSDGTVYNYTKWCAGEPNNAGVPENCLEISWTSKRCWNDAPCSMSMNYICEIKLRPIG